MLFAVIMPLFVFLAEIFLQRWWIGVMHRKKIEQVTKLYGPAWHENTKFGTPDMGGVVFAAVALLCVPVMMYFSGDEMFPVINVLSGTFWDRYGDFLTQSAAVLSYPILVGAVGLADDLLKYRRHSSDGLSSLQKLSLQILITVPWAAWMCARGGSADFSFEWPPALFILAVTFIGVGLQNAVNVTDGLDGLAAGCSLITFLALLPFTLIQGGPVVSWFNIAAAAICLGFLWHNCNPASVFMGDVGAHFLAGLMLSLCICSNSVLYIIPSCFFFGVEIFSVAVQIIAIRCFHRKVFKMSPIHHHFEMSGWKETQIVMRFCLIHFMGVLFLCVSYIVLLS